MSARQPDCDLSSVSRGWDTGFKGDDGGYISVIVFGGWSVSKDTISGASPVFVVKYVAQHVFINSWAKSISSSCRRDHSGDFFASLSGRPPVAPRAIVPGRKHARWSILGIKGPRIPSGRSPNIVSCAR